MKFPTICAVAVLALFGCVSTATPPVAEVSPPVVTDRSSVNPIAIERVVLQLPRGHQNGAIGMGLLCIPHGVLAAGSFNSSNEEAVRIVHQQFDAIGYPVTNPTNELFPTAENDATVLRLAGRVTDVHNNVCFPMGGFGDLANGSADALVSIEWQVYDTAKKTVVLKLSTDGFGKVSQTSQPLNVADTLALGMATRRFLASPEFQSLARTLGPSG